MAQVAAPGAILAMPAPDARLAYPTAMRHYARGIAYASLRDRAGFDRLEGLTRPVVCDAAKTLVEQREQVRRTESLKAAIRSAPDGAFPACLAELG